MASIQKSELHRISKHPSSLHPKQIHASQHPQDVFKHPRGTDSNVPQEDTQKHLDTRDADGWETVTGRHSRYRNGKQSNLQSREILPPSIENTDTSSLSSLLTETSPFSNGPPHSSQTIGNKNNAKPNAAKEKRPIEEKEQGRPIISTVEVSKYKEEEEVTKKKSITTNKLKAQQINWQNVACALNTLNISIAKVIHLMYSTDSLFKDICKFLGKKSSKSNLYSIHKTCRRYYHQIHLAEGIFTCDLLYCNGTPLVDPPLLIAKCPSPIPPVIAECPSPILPVIAKCPSPIPPVIAKCPSPIPPVIAKCRTPSSLTPTVALGNDEMNKIGNGNCLFQSVSPLVLMSLNNESPQKTQDTLYSDTDTFFKRNEISIEDDSHIQEDDTCKSWSNMTLNNYLNITDGVEGDHSLSPRVSTSPHVFVKALSGQKTSERNDISDLEHSYRTPVSKSLSHYADNDIIDLEHSYRTPVSNKPLSHYADNDISDLEHNEKYVDIGEEEILTNTMKPCVNTPDTSLNGASLQKASLHKDESYIQGNNIYITPNTKDQTSDSGSNMTLNDCDEETHSSTPRVSKEKRKVSSTKVKRELFKSKLSPFRRAFFKRTPVKRTARLPFGTMNKFGVKHNEAYLGMEKKSFGNKKFKEGEVVLSKSDWKMLLDETTGDLDDFVYPTMICGKYIQAINNTCVIKAKSKRKTTTNYIVYAQCQHKFCKSFKIKCSTKDSNLGSMKIELFSGGLHYLHDPKKQQSRQVRGVERLIHGQELKRKTADNYRDTIVTNTRDVKIDAGNMDHIKHLSTFQKISSEYKLSEDLDRDDYVDMHLTMKSMKECKGKDKLKSDYVQSVVEYPFTVHLYSKEQGDVISLLQNQNRTITAHIDSTGNLVRKSAKTSKRVFYYVLLINVPEDIKFQHEDKSHKKERSGTLFPVAEMITAEHTISSVLAWLTQFHFFVYRNCKVTQPLFTNIVSDQSFALLNAISFSFNDSSTIFVYLNMCHKVLTDQMQLSDRTTIINLCCTHYVKTIMHTMEPFFPGKNNKTRDRIMLMIVLLFNCKDYAAVRVWFRYFVIILCSKTINNHFENAYSVMTKTVVKDQTHTYDTNEIPTLAYPPDMLEYEESGKSAIYTEFLDLSNEVQQNLIESTCKTKNEFFNPRYLSCFLKRHVPYIPMFTPVMISKRGIPSRQSNANVESYFSQIKNYIHVGPQAEKCSRFVKNIRENVIEPKLKMIKLGIQSHQSYQKRTYKRKTDLNAVEKWKKKQRKYVKDVDFDPFIAKLERASAIEKLNAMDTNILDRVVSDGQQNEVEKHTSVQDNEILLPMEENDHRYYQVEDNDMLSRNISHPDSENTQRNDGQQTEMEKDTSVQDNENLLLMDDIDHTYYQGKDNEILSRNISHPDSENTQRNDGQQNEMEKHTSVQDNEIMLLMEDTENTQRNDCQVQETNDSSLDFKNKEKNSDAENVHSQTTTNSSISNSSLFTEYVYSQKLEKRIDEWNRHKKNNIVKDVEYYRTYLNFGDHYLIAKVVGLKREVCLCLNQLNSLKGENWLNSEVITYFLCHWSQFGVDYIPTEHSRLFLDEKSAIRDHIDIKQALKFYKLRMAKRYFTNDQFFKVPLFVPFNYQQNHFTLMILDFHRREFVYLDPFTVNYQSTKQTVMLMRNTLDIIKQIINLNCEVTYELHIEEWKIGNKKYTHLPAQRDTYNCGVYTIYYARKIIETLKSLPSEFEVTNSDPKICEKLRPILIEKVLEVSDSIRDRCILCLTKKSGTFVECGRCRNWFHVHCLPSECKRRYKKTKQNTHFLCGLCFRK